MNWEEILQVVEDIVRGTGQILMEGFGSHHESIGKSSAIDLVTKYDGLAEEYITGRLAEHFPEHRLMGEEGTATEGDSPFIWYIDPIDGTVNFAHGFPVFSVSIALFEGSEPRVGAVFDPTRDELFYAIAGRGSFVKIRRGEPIRLTVSGKTEMLHSLMATGFPYDRHTAELNNVAQAEAVLKKAQGLRRPGSAALDLCNVAAGRTDGYWEFKLKIWDVAAGALIVTEAGGRVSHIEDRASLRPDLVLNLAVSTPGIHDELLNILEESSRRQ